MDSFQAVLLMDSIMTSESSLKSTSSRTVPGHVSMPNYSSVSPWILSNVPEGYYDCDFVSWSRYIAVLWRVDTLSVIQILKFL